MNNLKPNRAEWVWQTVDLVDGAGRLITAKDGFVQNTELFWKKLTDPKNWRALYQAWFAHHSDWRYLLPFEVGNMAASIDNPLASELQRFLETTYDF